MNVLYVTSMSPKSIVRSTLWMSTFAFRAWFCTEGTEACWHQYWWGDPYTQVMAPLDTRTLSHNRENNVSDWLDKSRDVLLLRWNGWTKYRQKMLPGLSKNWITDTQFKQHMDKNRKYMDVTLNFQVAQFHSIICSFSILPSDVFTIHIMSQRNSPNPGVILQYPYNEELNPEHKTNNLAWR